jgi:hypothetical protein
MPLPTSLPSLKDIAADPLRWSAGLWFTVAAAGQAAFIGFIVAYYGGRTATGNLAGWNDKPLIDGYIAGDATGNLMFAGHVLVAAVVTLGGLTQLLPAVRRRWPIVHRWTGRIFIVTSILAALSGAWLTTVRGSYLSTVSAIAVLLNGALILAFAMLAWRDAIARRFDDHRRWALRTFMAVSGVWFLRVGIMGWILVNQGPAGMTKDMNGPADIVLTFGSYLIPLVLLELHFAAQRSRLGGVRALVAALIVAASVFTAAGVFGTVAFMWAPYL